MRTERSNASKPKNAAQREKLEAAIEDIKRMDRYIAKVTIRMQRYARYVNTSLSTEGNVSGVMCTITRDLSGAANRKEQTMYKDLIHDLRRYGLTNGTALGRHMGIMDEAADAIETLTFELEAAKKRADAAVEEICLKCHTKGSRV